MRCLERSDTWPQQSALRHSKILCQRRAGHTGSRVAVRGGTVGFTCRESDPRTPLFRPTGDVLAFAWREVNMDTISENMRPEDPHLPSDIDAHPVVRAAAALKPVLRQHHEEIEREQRLPPALVEQLRDAGFYKMVIPRTLGGLQLDTLTY